MNSEELKKELNLQFPSEIAGIKRPTEPVESKHDFFLKMPQLISKDPVLYNKMNLLLSILLSNDNNLKQNIDTILGKLDSDYAKLESPVFSGTPTVPTPTEQDNSQQITNTEWVQAWVKSFVAKLSNNIEVETQEDGHFSCPALGVNGLMAQNGYICLGKLFGGLILQWGYSSILKNTFYTDLALPIAYKKIFVMDLNDLRMEDWRPTDNERFPQVFAFCWKHGTNRVFKEIVNETAHSTTINFSYIALCV